MPQLKARKPIRYAGRRLQVGEVFEASRMDARLLVAVGSASPVTVPPPAKPAPRRAALLAAPVEQAPINAADVPDVPDVPDENEEEAPAKPKRTYRRRDMTASE